MNESIDLTKILKNCPTNWKFYSSIYGNVIFRRIANESCSPIVFSFIGKDKSERWSSVTEKGLYENYSNGECTFFPSKDQRDWNKFSAPWYKKEKFDPKTLKPFDKVIVRDNHNNWVCDFFSHIKEFESYPYRTSSGRYTYCVPYNDDTKHLVGTTYEAPEYYKL